MASSLNPHIFRAYDIRGKAGSDITEEGCRAIGHAFGLIVAERYNIDHPKIALGWDARMHSKGFADAAAEGLQAAGCEVMAIGQTPSPVSYFTICDQHLDGSIQITASHNPKDDNGLKLQVRDAEAFSGEDLQLLRQRIELEKPDYSLLTTHYSLTQYDAITPYLTSLQSQFPDAAQGLKVVVDTGNGVAGPVYNAAIRQAGAEVITLFEEPDGTFSNHAADPSKHATLKDLQQAVIDQKADIGIAFDGDGDRLGIVDGTGNIRNPDEILLLIAEDLLSRHPGATVVCTVSNSSIIESEVARMGGKSVMCKVGHSFVEHAMREHKALLGGEQSGHFFLAENGRDYDDALVAALTVLRILKEKSEPLSSILAHFPTVYQAPERRPHCPDDKKAGIIARATEYFRKSYPVNTLDGARIDFGDGAWAGIRQSNTSPCLSICIEARTLEKLRDVEDIVLGHLKAYPEITFDAEE